MIENLEFKEKHKVLNEELVRLSKEVFNKVDLSINVVCTKIAAKCEVTAQTVINYCNGQGSDGLLKQTIIDELKKMQ